MKGICFKEPLLSEVIEGRKTQTRRIIKPQPESIYKTLIPAEGEKNSDAPVGCITPKYSTGDVVYVQEPGIATSQGTARYFIRITGLRVERLQDIIEEDCIKEGIRHDEANPGYTGWYTGTLIRSTPQASYAALIDQINGRGTWDSNSWVWVYDYELYERS